MTKWNKKFGLIVSLCLVIILSVCGCGDAASESKTYGGHTGEELVMTNQALMTSLIQISGDELQQMLENPTMLNGAYMNMITQWTDIMDEVGSFVEFTDSEITESKESITVSQTCKFSNRDVTMTLVYAGDNMDMGPEDASIDLVYTIGETMAKAGMNTLMGLFTVFCMLIIISLIISCFGFIHKAQEKAEAKKNTPAAADQVVEQIQQREEQATDDLELVAVIAAAIAAATGQTTDDFVVRSIKRR